MPVPTPPNPASFASPPAPESASGRPEGAQECSHGRRGEAARPWTNATDPAPPRQGRRNAHRRREPRHLPITPDSRGVIDLSANAAAANISRDELAKRIVRPRLAAKLEREIELANLEAQLRLAALRLAALDKLADLALNATNEETRRRACVDLLRIKDPPGGTPGGTALRAVSSSSSSSSTPSRGAGVPPASTPSSRRAKTKPTSPARPHSHSEDDDDEIPDLSDIAVLHDATRAMLEQLDAHEAFLSEAASRAARELGMVPGYIRDAFTADPWSHPPRGPSLAPGESAVPPVASP